MNGSVVFIPYEHGGRQNPPLLIYTSQLYYNGEDWSCRYTSEVDHKFSKLTKVTLTFLAEEAKNNIKLNMPFLIREGNKTVGYGVIDSI